MNISRTTSGSTNSRDPRVLIEANRSRRPLYDSHVAVVAGWIAVTAVAMSVWEWAGESGRINPLFFSYPSAIFSALMEGLRGDLLTMDACYTLTATILGFVGSAVAGVIVAFLLSQSPYLLKVLSPFITALNTLPRVALAPLFVIWFGIGLFSHLIMAASLTFFVVYANTMAGIDGIDQDHLLLARLQGATRWQTFRWFVIPSALPSIFVGLELGFIFGMLGTVSGEMIVGEHGFGVRLQRDAGIFNTKGYFATLLALMVLSTLLTFAFQLVKRRLVRWKIVHITRKR